MNKKEIITSLTPYWKEYFEKQGLEKVKKDVQNFSTRRAKVQKINWVTLLSFLIHPYHLSYYISFKWHRRRALKSFWRLSEGIHKIKLAHERNIFSEDEWKNHLQQYYVLTLRSENEEVRMLIVEEVFKCINKAP